MEWLTAIVIGVLAGLVLNAAYRAISEVWPEAYYGKSEGIEARIASSPLKYLSFRLIPPFLTSVAVSVTAASIMAEPALLAVGSAALTHVSRNLHSIATIRRLPVGRRFARATYQMAVVSAVSVTMLGGYYASGILAPLVPTPRELIFSVWTAGFAAISTISLRRILSSRPSDVRVKSLESIPKGLILHAMTKASEKGIDAAIVLGIMISENAQRPNWVRRLERIVQKFAISGATTTQGLMQVRSAVPLSDQESIDLAIEENESEWKAPASLASRDEWWFQQAERHNIHHKQEVFDAIYFAYDLIESGRVPGWST